jgi:hypothetical protein
VLLSGRLVNEYADGALGERRRIDQFHCSDAIAEATGLTVDDQLLAFARVNICGQEYRRGQVLVVAIDPEQAMQPVFAELDFSVVPDPAKPFDVLHVVRMCVTDRFEPHRFCYLLKQTTKYMTVRQSALKDFRPLDMYRTVIEGELRHAVTMYYKVINL